MKKPPKLFLVKPLSPEAEALQERRRIFWEGWEAGFRDCQDDQRQRLDAHQRRLEVGRHAFQSGAVCGLYQGSMLWVLAWPVCIAFDAPVFGLLTSFTGVLAAVLGTYDKRSKGPTSDVRHR